MRAARPPPQLSAGVQCGLQPMHATQGMQHVEEVANDMPGICHIMWPVSNYRCVSLYFGAFDP